MSKAKFLGGPLDGQEKPSDMTGDEQACYYSSGLMLAQEDDPDAEPVEFLTQIYRPLVCLAWMTTPQALANKEWAMRKTAESMVAANAKPLHFVSGYGWFDTEPGPPGRRFVPIIACIGEPAAKGKARAAKGK